MFMLQMIINVLNSLLSAFFGYYLNAQSSSRTDCNCSSYNAGTKASNRATDSLVEPHQSHCGGHARKDARPDHRERPDADRDVLLNVAHIGPATADRIRPRMSTRLTWVTHLSDRDALIPIWVDDDGVLRHHSERA